MQKKLLLFLVVSSLLLSSVLFSNGEIELDLDGFETEEIQVDELSELNGFSEEEVELQEENVFSFGGDLAFKTSYGYHSHEVDGIDYSGFNQAKTTLYLQTDAKLSDNWKMKIGVDMFYDAIYDLKSNEYSDGILNTYQTQLMLMDGYLQGSITNDLDVKIGRQIVVWGKSDSIRITDVINPLDNRLPGMTDIEDLRLSVGMIKADYYLGQWNLSAIAIVENRIMLEASPRGEFFPVDKVFPNGAPNPFIDLLEPDTSLENMRYALAVNGVFSGWDLSFYAAHVLDQKWHLEGDDPQTMFRMVSPVDMLGAAINIVFGSWLIKGETAYLGGVKYNSTQDAKNRLDMLIGFDYMGMKDTVFSLEIANRHIFDYEEQMSVVEGVLRPDYVDENEIQTAIRATRSFANDSINVTALVSMFGSTWEYGGFARMWVEYDLIDATSANLGVVDYIGGDKPFTQAISDNDRIFADITYSF